MNQLEVFLVKPGPAAEILAANTPFPEPDRYTWRPLVLDYFAAHLLKRYRDRISIFVFHLIKSEDEQKFLRAVETNHPALAAFSEIDVSVNNTDRLAAEIRRISPGTVTVVGGKQSSLLETGDRSPFSDVDHVIKGPGLQALFAIIDAILAGVRAEQVPGEVETDTNCKVLNINPPGDRIETGDSGFISLTEKVRANYTRKDYPDRFQSYPSVNGERTKTALVFTGVNCRYSCSFCQSSYESGFYNGSSQTESAQAIAREIADLVDSYGANNIFLSDPNLDSNLLAEVYRELENFGIDSISTTGFLRAEDVTALFQSGLLPVLARKGLRVLSLGLDLPPERATIGYQKPLTLKLFLSALEICRKLGIVPLVTVLGSPEIDERTFSEQLSYAAQLPAALIEIRLAMALRNTGYFRAVEPYLIFHPDRDRKYFDRQNYRYQTIQFPDGIRPQQTYRLVNRLYSEYPYSEKQFDYIKSTIEKHPDTAGIFLNIVSAQRDTGAAVSAGLMSLLGRSAG